MYYGIVGNLSNDEFILKQNLLPRVENFANIYCNIYTVENVAIIFNAHKSLKGQYWFL